MRLYGLANIQKYVETTFENASYGSLYPLVDNAVNCVWCAYHFKYPKKWKIQINHQFIERDSPQYISNIGNFATIPLVE